jgi:Uncharacterized conserved protein
MFKHETNTFSPLPTEYRDFGPAGGPLVGPDAEAAYRDSGYSMAGLLKAAREAGAEVEIPLAARALPSGPVADAAFEKIMDSLCSTLGRTKFDAILLDLHGAMVTQSHTDGEGEILARLRAVAPGIPIAIALDFHGTITQRMVDHCDVVVGYKTYPHLDMVETGYEAGKLLLDGLRDGRRPSTAFARAPLLTSMLRQVTGQAPMSDLMAMARAAEKGCVHSVSVFGGFPLSDTPHTGLTVTAVTSGERSDAQRICQEICAEAMNRKEQFTAAYEPLPDSIARAKAMPEGPVLLIDHADNCHSGGTQDSMTVIAEALEQGLTNILAGPICDPGAVATLVDAGVGATVTLPVGGKASFAAVGRSNPPVTLTGVVRTISDGSFTVTGPLFTGMQVKMGRTVLLDTGSMQIVVSEDRFEAMDFAMFRILGIDESRFHYIVLKSKVQYKPTFGSIAREVVECNGIGVASLDFDCFEYQHLTRPIYPLDLDT